jgi:hypothetical protein
MSKNAQRLLAIVVLFVFAAIVEGEVLANKTASEPFGRTLIVVTRGARIESGLREFVLKRISSEIRERELGTVVRLDEKDTWRRPVRTIIGEFGISTVIEVNEFSMTIQHTGASLRLDRRSGLSSRVSQERATVFFGATILNNRLEEIASGTSFGQAEGYIASASTRPVSIYGYAFSTREGLKRQAASDAVKNFFDSIAVMMRARY